MKQFCLGSGLLSALTLIAIVSAEDLPAPSAIGARSQDLPCPAYSINTQDRHNVEEFSSTVSAEECSKKCLKSETCNFWTWHHEDSGEWALECVLMSSYGNQALDSNVISGSRGCLIEGIKPRQQKIEELLKIKYGTEDYWKMEKIVFQDHQINWAMGYDNCGAGWYDVQGQGVKNDYCRWVGNGDCRYRFGDSSWWSCALAGSNETISAKGVYSEPGAGCHKNYHGISCCEQGFTTGNMIEGEEIFIQAEQYKSTCLQTCKELYPESVGVTESLIEKYISGAGANKNKCWCEFGMMTNEHQSYLPTEYAKLDDSNKNYQTCVFEIRGNLGNRWAFQHKTIKYLGNVSSFRANASECCEVCRKKYPSTQFFEWGLEEHEYWKKGKYHFCSCIEPITARQPVTYYQEFGSQYCGTNSSFEAGVDGSIGDMWTISMGINYLYPSPNIDKVTDKSECCQRCKYKKGCDIILYGKSPYWEGCWYYASIPGKKVEMKLDLKRFDFSGVCDIPT